MTPGQRVLVHQIHPLKLGTDVATEIVSLPLFWRHRLRLALVVHFLPPLLASLALLRWGELEPYRGSPLGRYVLRHMTPQMQALRLAGDVVMVVGAWRRQPLLILAGMCLVPFGWLRGRLAAA